MKNLRLESIYDHLDGDSSKRIDQFCRTYTSSSGGLLESKALWNLDYFGLSKTDLGTNLDPSQRAKIEESLGSSLLREAQLIEVAGTAFTAKMSLLAETQDQRSLYSFFAADEARHLRFFDEMLGKAQMKDRKNKFFLDYLETAISENPRPILVLLVQVLLEGWGIRHYATLGRECLNENVAEGFKAIVLDEGKHHGSGLVLFNPKELDSPLTKHLEDLVAEFLMMIRSGPVLVVSELDRALGGLTKKQVENLVEQMQIGKKIESDLALVSHLLSLAGADSLCMKMTEYNLFQLPKSSEVVSTILSQLASQ